MLRKPLTLLFAAAAILAAGCDGEETCGPELADVRDLCTGPELAAGETLELYVEADIPGDSCSGLSCTVRQDVTQLYLFVEYDGCDSGPAPGEACAGPTSIPCELPPLDPAQYFIQVNNEPFGSIVVSESATETVCRF